MSDCVAHVENQVERLGQVVAESVGVAAVSDLQNMSPNVLTVLLQELLDEVAINRCPAIEAEFVANWSGSTKSAEPGRAGQASVQLVRSAAK